MIDLVFLISILCLIFSTFLFWTEKKHHYAPIIISFLSFLLLSAATIAVYSGTKTICELVTESAAEKMGLSVGEPISIEKLKSLNRGILSWWELVDSLRERETFQGIQYSCDAPVLAFDPYERVSMQQPGLKTGARIESFQGISVTTKKEIYQLLSALKEDDIAVFRHINPTPDRDLFMTVYPMSWASEVRATENILEKRKQFLGLDSTGVTFSYATSNFHIKMGERFYLLSGQAVYGPQMVEKILLKSVETNDTAIFDSPGKLKSGFSPDDRSGRWSLLLFAPSFVHSPQISGSFFYDLLRFSAGLPIRLLQLPWSATKSILAWHYIPKQWYALPSTAAYSWKYWVFRAATIAGFLCIYLLYAMKFAKHLPMKKKILYATLWCTLCVSSEIFYIYSVFF